MKKITLLTLAGLLLAGSLSACSPASPADNSGKNNPSASATMDPKDDPANAPVEKKIKDSSVQSDIKVITKEIGVFKTMNPDSENFRDEAVNIADSYDENPDNEFVLTVNDDDSYNLKGWNKDGWKFLDYDSALVYDSKDGFKNAWQK